MTAAAIGVAGCGAAPPPRAAPETPLSVAAPASKAAAAVPPVASTPPAASTASSPALADAAAARRQFDAARGQVEAAVAANSASYALRMQAAQFYMRAEDHPAALPHLQAAVKLSKREALPWIALGDAATLSDQYALANRAYAQAETRSPGNVMLYLGRGQLLIRERRFHEARKVLEAGRHRYPKDPEILFALGNLYLSQNVPKRAAKAWEQTLAVEPNRPDVHYLLALAHEKDLQLASAVQDLRAAVRLEPRMSSAWGRMGLYLFKLTRYSEARNAMQNAISLEPRESHYHWVLGQTFLADPSVPNHVDRAVEAYRSALALNAGNTHALQSLSLALTRHGTPEALTEAARLLNRLLAQAPNVPQTHYLLYRTYLRIGKKAEAARHAARFQALTAASARANRQRYRSAAFADTAQAHQGLGRKHLREKRYELAEKEFRLALERDPNHVAARLGRKEAARNHRSAAPLD